MSTNGGSHDDMPDFSNVQSGASSTAKAEAPAFETYTIQPGDNLSKIAKLKLGNMSVVYLPDDKSAAMDSYDPDHMPSTFVIDPNGIVRMVHYGYEKGDEKKVAAKLDALLK